MFGGAICRDRAYDSHPSCQGRVRRLVRQCAITQVAARLVEVNAIDTLPLAAQKYRMRRRFLRLQQIVGEGAYPVEHAGLLLRFCFQQRIDVDSEYFVQKGAKVHTGDSSPGFLMIDCDITDTHQFSQRLAAQSQFIHFLHDEVSDNRPAGRCPTWKQKAYPFKMVVPGKPITTFPLVDCVNRSTKVSSHLSHTETQFQSLLLDSLAYGFLEPRIRYAGILQFPREDEFFSDWFACIKKPWLQRRESVQLLEYETPCQGVSAKHQALRFGQGQCDSLAARKHSAGPIPGKPSVLHR